MTLKQPSTTDVHGPLLQARLTPERVLYDCERPVIFSTTSRDGSPLLAYLADEENDGSSWFFVAATNSETLTELERGTLSVREALTSGWMWQVRTDAQDLVTGAWRVTAAEIPEDRLPRPGTPLMPQHEALLVMRATGDAIVPGRVPSSVVSFVAEGARKAMKTLLDLVTEAPGSGRPREQRRALYDLPVRQVAFGSFEITFAAPEERLFDREALSAAAAKLDAIVRWAATDTESAGPWQSEPEREAMLKAAGWLTPPRGGPIQGIELSGRWMASGRVQLTRNSRKKVRMELRTSTTDGVVTLTGYLGELDKDKLTFILRGVTESDDTPGSFAEELLDDVMQYFADDQRVTVAGKTSAGKLHVSTIGAAAE